MCCAVGLDGARYYSRDGSWGKDWIVESGRSTGDEEVGRESVGGRIEDEGWRGEKRRDGRGRRKSISRSAGCQDETETVAGHTSRPRELQIKGFVAASLQLHCILSGGGGAGGDEAENI